MGDRSTAALVAVMALVSAGALALLFVLIKPSGLKEAEQSSGPSVNFPAQAPPAPDAPDRQALRPARNESSLGFIKKDAGLLAPSSPAGNAPSQDAAQAAARGDARAMIDELRKGQTQPPPAPAPLSRGSERLGDAAVREIMQTVVDAVHRKQPLWYREFLSRKDLKAIADRYDQSNDFKAFLQELSASQGFNRMLQSRSGKKSLRALVSLLLQDSALGPKLGQMLLEHVSDPGARALVRKYGVGAGLPADIVARAGQGAPGAERLKLKPMSSGGFSGQFGSGSSGGSAKSGAFSGTQSPSSFGQANPPAQVQFPSGGSGSASNAAPKRQFRSSP